MVQRVERVALSFDEDGAQLFEGILTTGLAQLRGVLSHLAMGQAGLRLYGIPGLDLFLTSGSIVGDIAAALIGKPARPVRALLFDKTPETNWSLAWHQDRTICVTRRIDVEGFGPWTVKSGMQHVAPPFDVLARMVTMRIHLDDVPLSNAPLLVAPGSHRLGRVAVEGVDAAVRQCGIATCDAKAGDVWAYATPILHASEVASAPRHRRVLQVDYSADDLPGGLEWLGIG